MAIDTSIYGNIKQPQIEMPSYSDAAKNALSLSQLSLQNRQMQQQVGDNDAVRSAFSKNVGPDGQVNRQGVLSDLARTAPMQAMDYQSKFAQQDKASADAKQQVLKDKINQMGMAAQMAMSAKDQDSYDGMLKQMQGMGMDTSHMPAQYDPGHMRALALASLDQKERLEAMSKGSEMDINQAKAPLERGKIMAETGHLNAETAKTTAETPKPYLGKIDPAMDPAELVRTTVPKEQQPKVFEEIKNAQDIKALAPKIREAFIMGSSRNPMIAAQGQRMFEGLINTTVKDAEGTTRQAAFDSIHKTMTPSGTFASPGENENRWKTVEAYLASKAAAPMAKGNRIDLAQFDSTSPYRANSKAPAGGGSSDGLLESTANAAETKGASPPVQTIRMVDPQGNIRLIPLSQKGEAIAAGGKVAK